MSAFTCPADHPHGDNATCYASHGCRCLDCREWNAGYQFMRRRKRSMGRSMPNTLIDSAPIARRLQALACLGWTFDDVGRRAGVTKTYEITHRPTIRRSTAEAIARVYDELSMRIPPQTTRVQRSTVARTKAWAARNGWLPPLAYDDIDNPETTTERTAA